MEYSVAALAIPVAIETIVALAIESVVAADTGEALAGRKVENCP